MAGARSEPSSAMVWTALGTVYLVWGTTYLAIRVVVETMPPLPAAAVRFLVAGAVLYAWAVRRGGRAEDRPTRRQWRSALIIGALLAFGGNGLVSLAEASIPSGLAALIIAVVPLWLALGDRLVFGKRLKPVTVVGLVTGFAGAALLVGDSIAGDFSPGGLALIICATLSWSCGSLYARSADLPRRPLVGAGMEMLCGGGVMLVIGLAIGEGSGLHPDAFSVESLTALAYLTTFGSIVAFTCYSWLIRSAPVSLVSTYAYVNPVVAVALGAVILGETWNARTLIAGLIIIASVALIVSSQGKPQSPGEEAERIRAASDE